MILSGEYSPILNENQVICASIRFNNSLNEIGWDKMYVKTYKECNVMIQVWAAGYLEGYISHQQIRDFYENLVNSHNNERRNLASVFDTFDQVETNIRKKITNQNL